MHALRWAFVSFLSAGLALVAACSDDSGADDDTGSDDDASVSSSSSSGKSGSSSSGGKSSSSSSGGKSSSSSSSGGSSSGGESSSSSGGSSSSSGDLDASIEPDASCTQSPTTLDAGAFCGAYDFRRPAVAKSPVDADAGSAWLGGVLVAGTYDATKVEYNGAVPVTIRETLVLDGAGRYTRVRQLVTDGSPGNVNRRSGTVTTEGTTIVFADDCHYNGETLATNETQSVQYEVVLDECGVAAIRYGSSGIRVTLKQH